MNRFLQLGANKYGRDFVIGDIHGRYDQLMVGLEKVNFNFDDDRLIAVGDLVDRGPKNMQCLEMLGEPWFYTVLGNHEVMMIDGVLERPLGGYSGGKLRAFWTGNGGKWYYKLWDYEIDDLKDIYIPILAEETPIAIEFIAENGMRIGVTHAGLPRGWTWDQIRKDLECVTSIGTRVVQECLWTRTKIQSNSFDYDVLGVDLLINGHTPSIKEVWKGNNVFIDLGACNGGELNPINVMDLLDRTEKNEAYAWREES